MNPENLLNEENNSLEKLSLEEINTVRESIDKNPEEVYALLQQTVETKSELFAGPLPHPDTLMGYKEIDNTFPDRIMSMAEKDADHHRKMEERIIIENFNSNKRGMNFGFFLSITAIGLGAWLISIGKDAYGIAAIITPLVGIASAFIYGKKENQKNNNDNNIE